mmetsp:Transcript_31022/g.36537  ORF Transcript_31022/g.36537 Transcript_31022/m.36537 type:complete len:243 (-) Transcript_31022:381-1109(-)
MSTAYMIDISSGGGGGVDESSLGGPSSSSNAAEAAARPTAAAAAAAAAAATNLPLFLAEFFIKLATPLAFIAPSELIESCVEAPEVFKLAAAMAASAATLRPLVWAAPWIKFATPLAFIASSEFISILVELTIELSMPTMVSLWSKAESILTSIILPLLLTLFGFAPEEMALAARARVAFTSPISLASSSFSANNLKPVSVITSSSAHSSKISVNLSSSIKPDSKISWTWSHSAIMSKVKPL